MKYQLSDLIIEVLEKTGQALSSKEIWDKAVEYGLNDKLDSYGKTPDASIGARIYTDIKEKGEKSLFVQVKKRPAKFALKGKPLDMQPLPPLPPKYNERDLHPLLASFVALHEHFKCYVKTIYHENSEKKEKGKNKWLHPDIAGVHFPFQNPFKEPDFQKETLQIIKDLNETAIKLFSFEMKKSIKFSNLRECYFQAVSNSSWANEGYLVALEYEEEAQMIDEMRRLTNAFGIGFIKLNSENVEQSEILVPADAKNNVDWDTVNRLVDENPDFKEFVIQINDSNRIEKKSGTYDKILDGEKIKQYVSDKKIPIK